ncbi:MAG: phosphorylcholine transferase LicD [Bacteroidaceae bacterium]
MAGETTTYTKEELARLQAVLYEILDRVAEVCHRHGLHYFVTGGTAIGAYFWDSILPWDDDVDVGMPREDYERFLSIAQKELGDDYFVQTTDTDPHSLFYFAKVRKNGTVFEEWDFRHVQMHQGIYVDIFPFDRIPREGWKERLQNQAANLLNGLLIAKEIWQWKYCGRCQVDKPRPRGFLPCLFTRILITLLPKKTIVCMLRKVQMWYNGDTSLTRCKNILTPTERVDIEHVMHPGIVRLGPLWVYAPDDLLGYLNEHYGQVRRDIPEEQRVSHRPARLKT